jgi:Tfp pilus assembly protein PilF
MPPLATTASAVAEVEPVADIARASPILADIAPAAEQTAALMPRAPAPGLNAAAATVDRTKKYGWLLVALVSIGGLLMLGRYWGQSIVQNVASTETGETQPQPPAVTTADPPAASAPNVVQVLSERPTDRFAYTGDAPEIDLAAAGAQPVTSSHPTATMPAKESTGMGVESYSASAGRAAVSGRTRSSTLSVTRAQGTSPIDAHIQAGYGALASGNLANARREYFAALELDPNSVDALMGAATVAAREGKPATALEFYATVLKLEPGNPDATGAMTMLRQGGTVSESDESRLKILIAADSNRPVLHAALGGVYAVDGRWSEAAQEYFTALAKDPGNPDLAFNVAASLDQNRNVDMALNYYRQTLAFARERATQIDLHAVGQRIAQLEARARALPAPVTP